MAQVIDIYKALDELAPFSAQESWDNSGILVGCKSSEVRKIMLTLDITCETAREAHEIGADLVISHHPVIFSPLKKLDSTSPAVILSRYNINAICMHTNFDIASGGMNDILCRKLGLVPNKGEVLIESENLGRVCSLSSPSDIPSVAKSVKKALECRVVRYNDTGKKVSRIGICSGSGASYYLDALEKNCDLLITGDIKHHEFIEAQNAGLALIDAGHFYTENIFQETVKAFLLSKIPDLEIVFSQRNVDIVNVI